MLWINFFQRSTHERGTTGFVPSEKLREIIAAHDGGEAYHCAFDLRDDSLKLEEDTGEVDAKGKKVYRYHDQTVALLNNGLQKTVTEYAGDAKPAFGYVWLDFDSKDGGLTALAHVKKFYVDILKEAPHCLFFYSGSKGFHLAIPFNYFGLAVAPALPGQLRNIVARYKKQFDSLDTTVFNPQRKFRALGSRHPKTKLFKILVDWNAIKNEQDLENVKIWARSRGSLVIPDYPAALTPLDVLRSQQSAQTGEAIPLDEWRKYQAPEGSAIFKQCGFIKWAAENPAHVNEPQWYAMASIVGRMKNGRKKFHDLSKGHPDYSQTATEEKLTQALQASGPRKCSNIDNLWSGCKTCPHYEKISSPIVIMDENVIGTEATGFYDIFPKTRIPNYNDILKAYIRDTNYKAIAEMRTIYTYNGTHYVEANPWQIKGYAEKKFIPSPPEKIRTEFVAKVYANEFKDRSFFNIQDKINFKNGIFDLNTGELSPHTPEIGFRHVLPYDYDPRAACPTFEWFINDVMLNDAALVAILQEYMGYIVSGCDYKYHKALWLSGTGRNGKSTFLWLLKELVGADNYATLSIKQIINDKFASSVLDGKIVNFSEETSPEELSDSGPFKNLTGDGEVLAQKKFGDPYRFRSKAKMVMTYNEIPILKDLSPGMLTRPIAIPWEKDLSDERSQDKDLNAKLRKELPGIFNFALAGWRRLEAQRGFTESEKSRETMEAVQIESCSAIAWFKENVDTRGDQDKDKLSITELYAAYKASVGEYAYGERKFCRRLATLRSFVQRRKIINGKNYYSGLVIKKNVAKNIEF